MGSSTDEKSKYAGRKLKFLLHDVFSKDQVFVEKETRVSTRTRRPRSIKDFVEWSESGWD